MVYYDSLRGTSKTKSKSNEEKIKKVLTQTETHDIISELRLRDTTTNAKQTCDVSFREMLHTKSRFARTLTNKQ